LLDIARLYNGRGSPRESEYFLNQAIDFADSVHAVGLADKGRIRLAELKIVSGVSDAAGGLLSSMKMRLFEVSISLNCSVVGDFIHPFLIVSPSRWRRLSPSLRAYEGEEAFEQHGRSAGAV
jgi:hypothetical protein